MRNTQKPKSFRAKLLLAFVSILSLTFLSVVVASGPVHADSPAIDALQKYCKSHIKSNGGDAGCTAKSMNRISDAVADDCKGNKNVQACVTNAGQDIIDQVAAKNPKNVSDFNDALTAAIKATNDAKKPAKKPADDADACVGAGCPATPTGQGSNCDNNHCDLISLYINPGIRLLSVIVGLVVAGSLVFGGVEYAASSGDPQKTSAAKARITNTLIAFLVYAFMFAFLNFLVPGGLFN